MTDAKYNACAAAKPGRTLAARGYYVQELENG